MMMQLQEVAIIQSTESANRIEGVTAPPDRLRELMAQKTTPANRSEEEIVGYRDVLKLLQQRLVQRDRVAVVGRYTYNYLDWDRTEVTDPAGSVTTLIHAGNSGCLRQVSWRC